MPEIIFNCSKCGVEIEVDETFGGNVAQCPNCNNTVLIPLPGIKAGMEFGGFRIERRLGVGGMGEVWLAYQATMDRRVALKILSPALTGNQDFVTRFMQEVKMAGKLSHPNIVTAYHAGIDKGIYYLAISYVDGVVLENMLKVKRLIPEKEALKIGKSIAGALAYAWNKFKILHRDIKPANIIIDRDGEPLIMDMGISKSISEDKALTLSGMIVGTPYYMSPEQARADSAIDCRSDIYALGATLYHMMTGEVPYDAATTMGVLAKHITEPFPQPQRKNPALSNQSAILLEVMMAKNPSARPQTWEDVIRDIGEVMNGQFPITKRCPVGKSLIMHLFPGTALKCRKIVRKPPKAHLIRKDEKNLKPSGKLKTVKTPLSIGIGAAFLIGIIGGIFLIKSDKEKIREPQPFVENVSGEKETNFSNEKAKREKRDAEERQKEQDAVWQNAVDFAKQALDNKDFDEAILGFAKIKEFFPDTEYDVAADEWILTLTKEKKAYLAKIQEEKKRDEEKSMMQEREKAAAGTVENESREKELAMQKKARLLAAISADLINADYKAAFKKYASSDIKDALPALRTPLEHLDGIDELILDELKSLIGEKITLSVKGQRDEIVIRNVTDTNIVAEVKIGKATIQEKIALKDITPNDRIKLLLKMDDTAKSIYKGVEYVKRENFKMAERHFAGAGILADPLKEYIDMLRGQKAEDIAKIEILKLLRKTGINTRSLKSDDISQSLTETKFSEYKVKKLKDALDEYKLKYWSTQFVKEHEYIFTLLAGVYATEISFLTDKEITVESCDMKLVLVRQGQFEMGDGEQSHKVKLSKPFWIGRYEVTQKQYEKITGQNPSAFKKSGEDAPVERVNWHEAVEFCRKLTAIERSHLPKGYVYRLPTEAEWEYCCRAGSKTGFAFGDSEAELYEYGNYADASGDVEWKDWLHNDGYTFTAPVGSYKPNKWGTYDMHGNVWEWCYDWSGDYPDKAVSDPIGPPNGNKRVHRGGGWNITAPFCCSSYRHWAPPHIRDYCIGFRVVLAPEIQSGEFK